MRKSLVALALLGIFSGAVFAQKPSLANSRLWTYQHQNAATGQSSEITAFDAKRRQLWVLGGSGLEILALDGSRVARIDFTGIGAPNSVAIHGDQVAISLSALPGQGTDNGTVRLYDASTMTLLTVLPVGATPDMVAFTPNGRRLLVANEGERIGSGASQRDPEGSVTIINVQGPSPFVEATVRFPDTVVGTELLRAAGVRIAPGRPASVDLEPEYIAVGGDSRTAYVSLQENNAIAVLDIERAEVSRIFSLGLKDFSLAGNEIDPTDRDFVSGGSGPTRTELRRVAARGLYQPDAIPLYRASDGREYLVMVNEGDARSDESDEARASTLGISGERARLTISTIDSTAQDLVAFGARSFSIRDTNGNIVFDSGRQLDELAIQRGLYDDSRSDNKGVEPEGVALARISGRTYAFIGMERTLIAAVAVYDVTDPADVRFVDVVVNGGDVGPEGLLVVEDRGRHYLVVANEVSHTTTLLALEPLPEQANAR
jgi:DNA-binding beta-propeller fold protein YncE